LLRACKAPAATQQSKAVHSIDLRDEAMGPGKSCLFFLMGQRHPWNLTSRGDMVLYLAKLHHSRRSRVLPSSPRKTEGKVQTPGMATPHFPSQGLSHACLRVNGFIVGLRMAHYNSNNLPDEVGCNSPARRITSVTQRLIRVRRMYPHQRRFGES
jgi:hypothetical protein